MLSTYKTALKSTMHDMGHAVSDDIIDRMESGDNSINIYPILKEVDFNYSDDNLNKFINIMARHVICSKSNVCKIHKDDGGNFIIESGTHLMDIGAEIIRQLDSSKLTDNIKSSLHSLKSCGQAKFFNSCMNNDDLYEFDMAEVIEDRIAVEKLLSRSPEISNIISTEHRSDKDQHVIYSISEDKAGMYMHSMAILQAMAEEISKDVVSGKMSVQTKQYMMNYLIKLMGFEYTTAKTRTEKRMSEQLTQNCVFPQVKEKITQRNKSSKHRGKVTITQEKTKKVVDDSAITTLKPIYSETMDRAQKILDSSRDLMIKNNGFGHAGRITIHEIVSNGKFVENAILKRRADGIDAHSVAVGSSNIIVPSLDIVMPAMKLAYSAKEIYTQNLILHELVDLHDMYISTIGRNSINIKTIGENPEIFYFTLRDMLERIDVIEGIRNMKNADEIVVRLGKERLAVIKEGLTITMANVAVGDAIYTKAKSFIQMIGIPISEMKPLDSHTRDYSTQSSMMIEYVCRMTSYITTMNTSRQNALQMLPAIVDPHPRLFRMMMNSIKRRCDLHAISNSTPDSILKLARHALSDEDNHIFDALMKKITESIRKRDDKYLNKVCIKLTGACLDAKSNVMPIHEFVSNCLALPYLETPLTLLEDLPGNVDKMARSQMMPARMVMHLFNPNVDISDKMFCLGPIVRMLKMMIDTNNESADPNTVISKLFIKFVNLPLQWFAGLFDVDGVSDKTLNLFISLYFISNLISEDEYDIVINGILDIVEGTLNKFDIKIFMDILKGIEPVAGVGKIEEFTKLMRMAGLTNILDEFKKQNR